MLYGIDIDMPDIDYYKKAEKNAQKHNVLLITSDQQHYMTLGINNPDIKTPNLDRLAKMGTVFDRAYTVNPTCTPSRASIITGKYPSQHGAWALGTKLMENQHCVGEDFQQAGYRTALVGKAHFQPLKSTSKFTSLESYPVLQDLNFWRTFHGPFYGFEHIEICRNHTDEAHVGQHYAIWMQEQGLKNWTDHFRKPTGKNNKPQYGAWSIHEKYHYNCWITERINSLLENYSDKDENFFLWASYFDPHPSYLVPEPWASMYDPAKMKLPQANEAEFHNMPKQYRLTQLSPEEAKKMDDFDEYGGNNVHGIHSHQRSSRDKAKDMAIYFGMVSMLDHYLGLILDKLDVLGLTEKTLVVFTTDHGHYFGQHGLIAKGPFYFEDGIKIPMIVSLPGKVPQNMRSNALQSLVDFAPTFLSIAGLNTPWGMSGIDQKEVWFGQKESIREHVIIEDRFQPTKVHNRIYINKRYKLVVYCNQDCGEIFDLQGDPSESKNLWDDPEYIELKKELIMKMLHAEINKELVFMPRISTA